MYYAVTSLKGFSTLSKTVDALVTASDISVLSKPSTIISWLSDRCLYKSTIQDACKVSSWIILM